MTEFDWVVARSDCTPDKVFETLAGTVSADLEAHAKLNPQLAQSLTFGKCQNGAFYVKRDRVHMVTFALAGERIKIERTSYTGEAERLMTISVSLDPEGQCILTDDAGKAWRPWQVRRQALEATFFGPQ